MTSLYPGGLDNLPTNKLNTTVSQNTHPALHNDADAAINAIEAELGINPSGAYVDVATRLDDFAASLCNREAAGNRVYPIGDSITAANGLPGSTWARGEPVWHSDLQYATWASLYSSSRVNCSDFYAIHGYTSADVLTTIIPYVLAMDPLPDVVPVLIGQNDINVLGYGQGGAQDAITEANLTAIFAALLAVYNASGKCLPVVCTLTPYTEDPDTWRTTGHQQLNAWLTTYAAANNLPLCDYWTACLEPGATNDWKAGYSADGIHPLVPGAQAMGQTLVNCLVPAVLPPWEPYLFTDNSDPTAYAQNPLLLTDSDSDGIPDAWTVTGAGATCTLAPDPTRADMFGNIFSVTRGANDLIIQTTAPALAVEHRFELSFWLKFTANGGTLSVAPVSQTTGHWLTLTILGYAGATGDIPWSKVTFSFRNVDPNAPHTIQPVRLQILLGGAVGAQVEIAQVTLRDLDADRAGGPDPDPEQILLTPNLFTPSEGAPTLALATGIHPAFTFDKDTQEAVIMLADWPHSWVFDIYLLWYVVTGTATSVVWQFLYRPDGIPGKWRMDTDDSPGQMAGTMEASATVTASVPATNYFALTPLLVGAQSPGFAISRPMIIGVRRVAAAGADTFVGDALMMGLVIERSV